MVYVGVERSDEDHVFGMIVHTLSVGQTSKATGTRKGSPRRDVAESVILGHHHV